MAFSVYVVVDSSSLSAAEASASAGAPLVDDVSTGVSVGESVSSEPHPATSRPTAVSAASRCRIMDRSAVLVEVIIVWVPFVS